MITAIINHPKAEELNLAKRLGLLNSGAAPMAVELIEKVKDMGIFFSEGFGMSESTSLGICNPILGMKKVGQHRHPLPGQRCAARGHGERHRGREARRARGDHHEGPAHHEGVLEQPRRDRGPAQGRLAAYRRHRQADEDGYLFIVDRKKDMIIAGGFNIYPREIDEVLYQHPKIAEAASVGVPDEYRGETVKAFIVLKPGQTATDKEIIDFCKTKLTAYKVPKQVEFRESLPKSAVGKILRKVLKEEEAKKHKKP